jgi:hypothetical protein
MLFVKLPGVIEIRLADSGMAINTLLAFFLGVFGSSDRERHK